MVEFTITDAGNGELITSLTIDGFSGRAAIGGVWQDFRFGQNEHAGVRQRIYSVLTDALDKLTAV